MLGPMYAPAHPGALVRETIEGLSEETGQPQTLTRLARALGMTRKTLSALVNERNRVTPEMALRLATGFQNTTADFWLRAQQDYDLADARNASARIWYEFLGRYEPTNRQTSSKRSLMD